MTPLGIVVTAVILLPIAVVLVFMIVWWVKNVGRHRIPRPFLGEGPNVEWAEMKRAELASGEQEYGPEEPHSSYSPAGVLDGLESENQLLAHDSKENGRDAPGSIPQDVAKGNDELLTAWLEDTGHFEDEWAERLLGDQEHTKET